MEQVHQAAQKLNNSKQNKAKNKSFLNTRTWATDDILSSTDLSIVICFKQIHLECKSAAKEWWQDQNK